MKASFILLLLGAALISGTVGFFVRDRLSGSFASGDKAEAGPERGRLPLAVTALGRLEPQSKIVSVGVATGSRIERLTVQEGDFVKPGATLAYLDTHSELTAVRDHASRQVEEATKRREAETAGARASLEEAQLRLKQAQEVAPLGIQAQEAEERRSLAEWEKAKLDLKRAARLFEDKAMPRSQYDASALAARQAEEQHERNQATLTQLRLDQEIKLQLAQAGLKTAQAELDRVQVASQVDSLVESRKLAEAQLERTVIRAPIAGEIIKVLAQAGESVGPGPILKMGNTQSMYAVAEVYETDARYVQAGQEATITSKAFPGENIMGKVEHVGSLVHKNALLKLDPTADADARVIEVRIRLGDSRLACRYNQLQVDVSIRVEASGAEAAHIP